MSPGAVSPTPRSTLRRKRERGSHERATIDAVLDEGLVCHVGLLDGGSVFVVPTAYARVGDDVLLHGAVANRTLRALADGAEACVTVTLVDGLVLSRSAFHHSMNYRSVMLFGTAEKVTDEDDKRAAVFAIVEHLVPGRSGDTRPPTPEELRSTLVLRFPIRDGSAKVRQGDPIEEAEDLALGHWAGVLPLTLQPGVPVPDEHLAAVAERAEGAGVAAPAYLVDYHRPHRSDAPERRALREAWEAAAPAWIAWARTPGHDSYWRFHRDAFLPLVPAPAPAPEGLTIDVGCGEGRVSRDLSRLGHRVVGVDASPAMATSAAAHPEGRAPVMVGDAASLPVADGVADCVVAFMSLQDVDGMEQAVAEIGRVLRPGGRLVMAITHPANTAGTFVAGDDGTPVFVLERSWFARVALSDTCERDGLTMTFHSEHRPLHDYTDALADAGFLIERVREVGDTDPAEKWHAVPLFLHIRAVRTGPSRDSGAGGTTR